MQPEDFRPPADAVQPLEKEGAQALTVARALTITDPATYVAVAEQSNGVKAIIKKIEDTFRDAKKRAHEAHREVVATEARLLEGPKEALRLYDRALADYAAAEERERRKKEAELREIERKKMIDAQVEQAVQVEAAGDSVAAQEILDRRVMVPAPIVESERPKVAGLNMRDDYKWRPLDHTKALPVYLQFNEKSVSAVVKAAKFDAVSMVGEGSIEVYVEKVPVRRI